MVSTRPLISKSSSPCTHPLVAVPRAPTTIGITVTFMLHSFLLILLGGQPRLKSLQFGKFSFFLFLLIITRSGRLAEIRWSVCISKSRGVCASHSRLYIYHLVVWSTPCKFFSRVLIDDFTLKPGWQWVSSSLQDFSMYSRWLGAMSKYLIWIDY